MHLSIHIQHTHICCQLIRRHLNTVNNHFRLISNLTSSTAGPENMSPNQSNSTKRELHTDRRTLITGTRTLLSHLVETSSLRGHRRVARAPAGCQRMCGQPTECAGLSSQLCFSKDVSLRPITIAKPTVVSTGI